MIDTGGRHLGEPMRERHIHYLYEQAASHVHDGELNITAGRLRWFAAGGCQSNRLPD